MSKHTISAFISIIKTISVYFLIQVTYKTNGQFTEIILDFAQTFYSSFCYTFQIHTFLLTGSIP